MNKNYHCLIAGLPDLSIDNNKLKFSLLEFKQELKDILFEEDYTLIKIFFYKFDNQNILNLLHKKNKPFIEAGNYTVNEFEEQIKIIKEGGYEKRNMLLPEYLENYIDNFINETPKHPNLSPENQLSHAYYEYAINSENDFISKFYDFELNILNILTALNCRKFSLKIEDEIINVNEISQQIRKSSAKDFGIGTEFDYIETLIQIAEEPNLFNREKKIDILRWEFIENETFFNYFTIEKVFVYLIKLEILDRWLSFNKETGTEKFSDILKKLESSYEIPKEF